MSAHIVSLIRALYAVGITGLALYGVHNLIMVVLFLRERAKRARHPHVPLSPPKLWPHVTVQLPIFNEKFIIERLLSAVTKLEYPAGLLQIQVLDDSTDDTSSLTRTLVKQYQKAGVNIEYLHRSDRSGFKAGALKAGLNSASGELIAVFDADFVPAPDWLYRTVPSFVDEQLGCLQTRWGHTNYDYDAFTRAISLGIDGHFVVEQSARSANRLLMNFNGTAGIWRRACISDAGGWQSDTLTEDLDLSYRAQLRGWRIAYLPEIVVPAELPATVEAFKKQQYRWAKGGMQSARKLIPQVLGAKIPLHRKILGIAHLSAHLVSPMVILSMIMILPIGLLAPKDLTRYPWALVSAIGPLLVYFFSATEHAPRFIDRLRVFPLLLLIGFGLSVNNSLAVFEGLFGRGVGTFVRTPKFNLGNGGMALKNSTYIPKVSKMVAVELLLAAYTVMSVSILLPRLGIGIMPWLLAYAFGNIYIAVLNLMQTWYFARSPQRPAVENGGWFNRLH